MVKLKRAESDALAQAFINYLESNGIKKTYAKPDLREIYLEFRPTVIWRASFSEILFHMSRRQRRIWVQHGHVYFKGTADWAHYAGNKFQKPSNPKAAKNREDILCWLRSAKARDALLKGGAGIVSVLSFPEKIEKQFGYFTFDVEGAETNHFQMVVQNTSPENIILTKCLFLRESKVMMLHDEEGCTDSTEPKPVTLKPMEYYSITVMCTLTKDVASYCGDVFFCFKTATTDSFMTMRYLRCIKSDDITRLLQPTSPYQKRKAAYSAFFVQTVPGEKVELSSSSNKLKFVRELPQYPVKTQLKEALKRKAFEVDDDEFVNPAINSYEQEMQDLLSHDLTLQNYGKKFSCLLHLEEIQSTRDIHAYDLKEVELKLAKPNYYLDVPGLAERRPSVLRGDKIFVTPVGETSRRFEGYVHVVERDRVGLRFGRLFKDIYLERMKFNVTFSFNRFPIRLMHRAIEHVGTKRYQNVLFPDTAGGSLEKSLRMYDKNLDHNEEQKKAVESIFYGTCRSPYIIYGPPGTGKTVTMVEAIKQIVNLRPETRVLICAPSNSACDLMLERLLAHVDTAWVFRMCAMSRPWSDVPQSIRHVTNYDGSEYYYPSKEELMKKRVIATTLITAGRISSACFPQDHFDYVFVDEAGHAVEPEFMIAVENILSPEGRVIMAGDPQQLGPIIRSSAAVQFDYGKSFMERLMDDCEIYRNTDDEGYDSSVITKLLKNYRSHPDILKLPNELFYDNELQACSNIMMRTALCTWEKLPQRNFPLIFHGVEGEDMREGNSPSYFNPQEVSKVYDYVVDLLATRHNSVRAEEIGIISPYRQQVKKIRKILSDSKKKVTGSEKIKVGSVEEFQGQERKVIIISTVRSDSHHLVHDKKFHLGFLQNPKRFNVAITRAKALLIVIGNPNILALDYYWRRLLDFCKDRGGCRGTFYDPENLTEATVGGEQDDDSSDDDGDDVGSLTRQMAAIGLQAQIYYNLSVVQKQVVPEWRNEQ